MSGKTEEELIEAPPLSWEEKYKELEANYLDVVTELADWKAGRRAARRITVPEFPTLDEYNKMCEWLQKQRIKFINTPVPPKPLKIVKDGSSKEN